MNILFISDRQALPTFGGIERVIINLAHQFTKDKHSCFHAYFSMIDEKQRSNSLFKKELVLKQDFSTDLEEFITLNSIDFVINNCIVKKNIKILMPNLKNIKTKNHVTKFCFLYHNSCDCAEKYHCDYSFYVKRFTSSSWRKADVLNDFSKSIIFDLFPRITSLYFKKKYRRISNNEQNLVLLSKYYKKNFANVAKIATIPHQWHAINNSLSFELENDVDFNAKEKSVLLVARMEEDQKRISKALEIWERVQRDANSTAIENWNFIIVGDGKDRTIYESIVKDKNISRVQFEGWQDSLPYYMKSSIFIMVSVTEGFPMTLMESKQCGCVPIAYDSFEAVHDVIEDNVDGFIVRNNDINGYVERLVSLMQDDILRNNMAKKGIVSAQKFSVDKIAQEWYNYYNQLK